MARKQRVAGETALSVAAVAAAASLVLPALTACGGEGGSADGEVSVFLRPESTTEPPERTTADEVDLAENTGGRISVSAIGDGPIGLMTSDAVSAAVLDSGAPDATGSIAPARVSGRLVIGSGSCFALKEIPTGAGSYGGAPALLVLPEGTDLTTRGGRPSVTFPGEGTVYVGETTQVTAVRVPVSALDGVPERCTRGGAGEALIIR